MSDQTQALLTRLNVNLETGENVLELIQKHWGGVMWPLLGLGVLATLTLLAFIFAAFLLPSLPIFSPAFFVMMILATLSMIGYALTEWYGYQRSALIITDQRIIDFTTVSLIATRIQTIDIYEVQSSAGALKAGWGTMFHYGQISINTIGDQSICVYDIPSPELVATQIMHYHNLVAHGGVDSQHGEIEGPGGGVEVTLQLPPEQLANLLRQVRLVEGPAIMLAADQLNLEITLKVPIREVAAAIEQLKQLGATNILTASVKQPIKVE